MAQRVPPRNSHDHLAVNALARTLVAVRKSTFDARGEPAQGKARRFGDGPRRRLSLADTSLFQPITSPAARSVNSKVNHYRSRLC
jgi:hypothetical protein